MDWIEKIINDETKFPPDPCMLSLHRVPCRIMLQALTSSSTYWFAHVAVPFPKDFLKIAQSIFRLAKPNVRYP
jgi:hypothetical protein